MSRKFFSAAELLKQHPGNRALILLSPAGESVLWKQDQPAPEGKWVVIGVISG